MRASKARNGRRTAKVCPTRWSAYGKTVTKNALPLHTQGGSRMPTAASSQKYMVHRMLAGRFQMPRH